MFCLFCLIGTSQAHCPFVSVHTRLVGRYIRVIDTISLVGTLVDSDYAKCLVINMNSTLITPLCTLTLPNTYKDKESGLGFIHDSRLGIVVTPRVHHQLVLLFCLRLSTLAFSFAIVRFIHSIILQVLLFQVVHTCLPTNAFLIFFLLLHDAVFLFKKNV